MEILNDRERFPIFFTQFCSYLYTDPKLESIE